ncbi:hypothetical protein [Isoptericola sp. NPDC057391]|uniref:hypothetical protein n=1 Tax=Isoptericola sp. NPDC057391 TaxID=3346117 RepID=UPI003636C518
MEHRRRSSDLEPGEHLLLSPLSAVPLPMPWTVPAGRRRWPALRPEAMWHPLLWLPRRLGTPRVLRDPAAGRTRGEAYDEWALRVVLELTESAPVTVEGGRWLLLHDPAHGRHVRPADPGDDALVPLYDAHSGTWLDVLATVGLDVDDPADVARVRAWLDGEPDEALDRVDLDRHLRARGRDEAWALHRAQGPLAAPDGTRTYVEDLRDASSALVAREIDALVAVVDAGAGGAAGLARLAAAMLSPAPDVAEDLGLTLHVLAARLERAATPTAARAAAADLRGVLGAVADAAAPGLRRTTRRAEAEAEDVLCQARGLGWERVPG